MLLSSRTRKVTFRALLLLATLATTACSTRQAQFWLANIPAASFSGEIVEDVIFSPEKGLGLDIYHPAEASETPRPVVVFFYGGNWIDGRKEQYRFIGITLAQQGYIAVLPDYRKFPPAQHPDPIEDGAEALDWVFRNASDIGADPARIFVSGHSAGAHLGAMLTVDERYLATLGQDAHRIAGFAGLAGPYHFTPRSSLHRNIFNAPGGFDSMQAGNFIEGDEPPLMFQHGERDRLVGTVNIERLEKALDASGGCYRTRLYPDLDHTGIIAAFTWAFRPFEDVVPDMIGFFDDAGRGEVC